VKEMTMKQVKSLVLAVSLVFALSAGAHGGDIGSPGIATPPPGDLVPKATTTIVDPNSVPVSAASDSTDLSNQLVLELVLALLTLS
jgi:hypothetical protein